MGKQFKPIKQTEYQLIPNYSGCILESGCDEAGRGCLAGPVVAAAVILPADFRCSKLTDSKQLSENQRNELRIIIEKEAWAWAVAFVDEKEIDRINILNASILAMHRALETLKIRPEFIIVDGNNISDLFDDRPGILITYKNNFLTPLINEGISSDEVKKYLKENNIEYNKSTTCLATRIKTNIPLNHENIKRIDYGEEFIKNINKDETIKIRDNDNKIKLMLT